MACKGGSKKGGKRTVVSLRQQLKEQGWVFKRMPKKY